MRMKMLTGVVLFLSLAALPARGNDAADVAVAAPERDAPELPRGGLQETAPRKIGELEWYTDYSAAYRQARESRKMLFLFFRDEQHPRLANTYEQDVLAHADLVEPLSEVVRVVLPLDAKRPHRVPELPDLTLLSHSSFNFMYGRQGIAMIDLTEPETELYGQVVSAHAFTQGRYYTVRGTKIVLGLPPGTVTQRALIYAVRLHPAAPVSTTDGKCHGFLCKQARNSSKLMATYESVGHHDWGMRSGEIANSTGRFPMEVAAMGGNLPLIDAAIVVVDQWYGSPAHWGIMSGPPGIFGYDLVRAPSGNWYGTGIFAN